MGRRKEDPHKIWRDEVEENLSIVGVQTGGQWPGTVNQEWRKTVFGRQGPHREVVLKNKNKIRGSHKNLKPMLLQCRKP
jgi:hypothetical protein